MPAGYRRQPSGAIEEKAALGWGNPTLLLSAGRSRAFVCELLAAGVGESVSVCLCVRARKMIAGQIAVLARKEKKRKERNQRYQRLYVHGRL